MPMNYTSQFITWTAGELSPHLQSRTDLQQYDKSAQILQNTITRVQGDQLKRPGTVYVGSIANPANNARLIPMQYSNTNAYIIEMGAGYFRFYTLGAQLLSTASITNGTMTSNITGWTTEDSGTGTAAWNSANGGSCALAGGSSGVGAITQLVSMIGTSTYTLTFTTYSNSVNYSVTYNSWNATGSQIITNGTVSAGTHNITFAPTLGIAQIYGTNATLADQGFIYISFTNTANNTAYVNNISLNNPIYQIDNPFAQNELDNVQFVQSFDTIYFVHANHPPRFLKRYGDSNWVYSIMQYSYSDTLSGTSFTVSSFINSTTHTLYPNLISDGPYYSVTDSIYGGVGTAINIQSSAKVPGTTTLTASASLFVSTDVGRMIRYRASNSDPWGTAIITAYSSSTSVTAHILAITTIVGGTTTNNVGFDTITTNSMQWKLGQWSDTTGWPSVISLFQQRLIFASTGAQQQSIWFSQAGNLVSMQADDSGYDDNIIDTAAINVTIADNLAATVLWLLPRKYLFIGTSGGTFVVNQGAAYTSITPSDITITPTVNEPSSIYPPITARTALLYIQKYGTKILEISYRLQDDNFITNDLAQLAEHATQGQIKWMAPQAQPNYLLWMTDQLGGLHSLTYLREQNILAWNRHILGGSFGSGNPFVYSIASITAATEDQIWMIVQRTINGSTVQYIEYFSPTFTEQAVTSSNFLDCSITYSGAATSTLTGASFLEGQTVQCFDTVNGVVVPVVGTVSSGTITLSSAVTGCVIGLPYVSIIQTNPIVPQMPGDFAQSELGRAYKVLLYFHNTYGGKIGDSATNMDVMPYFNNNTIMGGPLMPVTGMFEYRIPSNITYIPTIYIQHDLPVPFNLVGMVIKSVFNSPR